LILPFLERIRGLTPPARLFTLVAFGLGLRLVHYWRDPSMWHDEAALVLNVLGKGFGEMFGPLLWSEAAPPLFLWVERAAVLLLGDGTRALRLVPFLASCAALGLLVPLARGLLAPRAVPWAVLLFACSDRLLWHCCETKPYAVDVLAAVGLPLLYLRTRAWPLGWRLGLFTALAPAVIFLSFPGGFLYGGLLVGLLVEVRRRAPARTAAATWVRYAVLVLAVFAAFTLLVLGPVRAQRCAAMDRCWEYSFPDWRRPWALPFWAVWSTLEVVDYCYRPMGGCLAVLALVGGLRLGRRSPTSASVLLLPMLAAQAACLLGAYPYTGARVMAYAAPALALVIAEGVPASVAWLRLQIVKRLYPPVHERTAALLLVTGSARAALAVIYAGLLLPVYLGLYHLASPWERADFAGAAAYVHAHRQPDDLVVGNSWEVLYYFRHLGPALLPLERPAVPPARRVWLVVTARIPATSGCGSPPNWCRMAGQRWMAGPS
jgi:hypothetical protein